MKLKKMSLILGLVISLLTSFNVSAVEQSCASGVLGLLATPVYANLNSIFTETDVSKLKDALSTLSNETQYKNLLSIANDVAAKGGKGGRLVVTLADGTVVVDTKTSLNTYANFLEKTINENHNTRVAILDAQRWPCGIGLESRVSSSTGDVEFYLAKRLGDYLNSFGTARINK